MSHRSKSSPQVHQIKAIFEGFRHGHTRASGSTSKGASLYSDTSTDNLVEKPDKSDANAILHLPDTEASGTIESVGATQIRAQLPAISTRPALSAKPSWIGPVHQDRFTKHTMSCKVTITYAAPDLRPPVYITTSLSNPAWDILEMSATKTPHGELLFHIDFDATEGEYQYKFRLGPGDWWVCDESKPTIDDGLGNRNNLLLVEGLPALEKLAKVDSPKGAAEHSLKVGDSILLPGDPRPKPVTTPSATAGAARDVFDPETDVMISLASDEDSSAKPAAQQLPSIDTMPFEYEEQEHAPLMKHESTSPRQYVEYGKQSYDDSPLGSTSSKSSFGDDLWPEADPNDPSLHQFPTHHEGIINEIKRAHQRLPEDQPGDVPTASSPRISSSGISKTSLPSVSEASEEMVSFREDISSPRTPDGELHNDQLHASTPDADPDTRLAQQDMEEERAAVAERKHSGAAVHHNRRSPVDGIKDAIRGLALAVVTAIIAMLLYGSGLLPGHDPAKDGGAAIDN